MNIKNLIAAQVQKILSPSLAVGLALTASCGTVPESGRTVEEPTDGQMIDTAAPGDTSTPKDAAVPGDAVVSLCDQVVEGVTSEQYAREPGFFIVAVGEECPDAPPVLQVSAYDCCPFLDPKEVCGFKEKQENVEAPIVGNVAPPQNSEKVTVCVYDTVFESGGACCGRPLLESGHMVLAPARADISGWDGASRLQPSTSSPEAIETAGAYWLEAARMEHASIASFSRFAIELLRLGAPSDLVMRAHEAARDEIGHARLCFGLASEFLMQPLGPGPLPLGDSLQLSADRADFAESVALEGCVGETLAALEAAARLRHVTDPTLRAALTLIIDEETDHAALAWETLTWLLEVDDDPKIRTRLREVFAERPTAKGGIDVVPLGGETLGLLSDAQRDDLFERGWSSVIAPALKDLLG